MRARRVFRGWQWTTAARTRWGGSRSTHDDAGNLITQTDATSRTSTYGYDAEDDAQSISYSDGVTPNVGYTYTNADQRLTMADGTGTTNYN